MDKLNKPNITHGYGAGNYRQTRNNWKELVPFIDELLEHIDTLTEMVEAQKKDITTLKRKTTMLEKGNGKASD